MSHTVWQPALRTHSGTISQVPYHGPPRLNPANIEGTYMDEPAASALPAQRQAVTNGKSGLVRSARVWIENRDTVPREVRLVSRHQGEIVYLGRREEKAIDDRELAPLTPARRRQTAPTSGHRFVDR